MRKSCGAADHHSERCSQVSALEQPSREAIVCKVVHDNPGGLAAAPRGGVLIEQPSRDRRRPQLRTASPEGAAERDQRRLMPSSSRTTSFHPVSKWLSRSASLNLMPYPAASTTEPPLCQAVARTATTVAPNETVLDRIGVPRDDDRDALGRPLEVPARFADGTAREY